MTEKTIVAIDGTDALAFVIIRPGAQPSAVSLEAAASGIGKEAAAYVLRNVADQWHPVAAEPQPGTAITSVAAAHVLHHLTSAGEGYPAGSFTARLLALWEYADDRNAAALATAFPAYGAAIALLPQPGGVDRLRSIVTGREG